MMEAVVRTRFSRGYRVGYFVTPVLISNGDLLICSNLDSDQSYTMLLDVSDDQSLSNDNFVYFQVSLNYLDCCSLYTHWRHKKNKSSQFVPSRF